jgi:hypothetical protein
MDADMGDFLLGALALATATAAYAHVIRTLRTMHIENTARLKKLEDMMKAGVSTGEREARLDTLRAASEILSGENKE